MLKANEIYLLNEALDSKDIYGINKQTALEQEIHSKNKAIDTLKKKKIINDDNSMNEVSYHIIRNLDIFKKANSYIWLNDILLSLDNTQYMVFLKKDSEEDEFEFKKIIKADLMYCLLKEYSFLCKGQEKVSEKKLKLSSDEFVKEYIIDKDYDDLIIIRKEENKRINYTSAYITYYLHENILYKYDALKEELYEISPINSRLEIAKIFNIEVKNE
ncbi:DUF5081 family protein [Clostridium sp. MB05]|uniref:DUF5081 family protein n=1 Tax=Clostridium sp. MB05 TaxID=3376682 RepID=UPI003982D409